MLEAGRCRRVVECANLVLVESALTIILLAGSLALLRENIQVEAGIVAVLLRRDAGAFLGEGDHLLPRAAFVFFDADTGQHVYLLITAVLEARVIRHFRSQIGSTLQYFIVNGERVLLIDKVVRYGRRHSLHL